MATPSSARCSGSGGPPGRRARADRLEDLASRTFDLVVVGGGITGAAIADAAARRGASVALIEREDFACGASGHSSKLLHGGLRYLAQGHVRLVREALRERARLLEEVPSTWAHRLLFLLPLRGRRPRVWRDRVGTWLYERLAWGHHLGPRRVVGLEEVVELVPYLARNRLRGGVLFSEVLVDDTALTQFRVDSASRQGAVTVNHAEALGAVSDPAGGFVVDVHDRIGGRRFAVRCRRLANATGAWMGRVPFVPSPPRLMPSKGVHLVFRKKTLPVDVAVILEAPDRRPTFVLPYGSLVVVGTTDTPYPGDPSGAYPEPADVRYLLRTLRAGFPSLGFHRSDVIDAYAGVRPLIAAGSENTSELSREDIEVYDPRGAVAVAGGKLTNHRAIADRVLSLLALPESPGQRVGPARVPMGPGEEVPSASAWVSGTELLARLSSEPHPEDWEELRRRVEEAIGEGGAETLEDILDRRLHALNRREASFDRVVDAVSGIVGRRSGAPSSDRSRDLRSYRDHLASEHRALEGDDDD